MLIAQWDPLGTNSLPILLKAVEKPNSPNYKQYKAFWSLLPSQIQKLLPYPINGSAVRTNAALLLTRSENSGSQIIPILIRLCGQSSDPNVRRIALWALGLEIDPHDNVATAALIAALNDPVFEIRDGAITLLSMYGRDQSLVFPALTAYLTDPDPKVRDSALASLNTMADGTDAAINHLINILDDKDAQKRALATNILKRIAPEALAQSPRDQ